MSKELLKMIEEVDHNNWAKLDEIDGRFHAVKKGWEWKKFWTETWSYSMFYAPECQSDISYSHKHHTMEETLATADGHIPQYSRCRNTLKAARPRPYDHNFGGYQNAWYFQILPNGEGEWRCEFGRQGENC